MPNSKNKQEETGNNRLDSWKDIAHYLGRDVTTVMRWERERALPVHRVPGHAKRQTVYAYPHEIDKWLVGTGTSKDKAGTRDWGLGTREAEGSAATEHPPPTTTLGGDGAKEKDVMSPWMAALVPHGRRQFLRFLLIAGCVVVAAVVVYSLTRPPATPKVLGYHRITNDGLLKGGPIATDGMRIYFTEMTPSGSIIVQAPVTGGEVKPLSTFFKSPSIHDLSRSRSELLILDQVGVAPPSSVWALSLSGGAPRRVGNIITSAAAWMPDGNSIVYGSGHELFLCNLDGSGPRKFASLPGRATSLHWSPNGKMLRFDLGHPEKETEDIWEVRADGFNAHPLLPGWRPSYSQEGGQWTPDGKYFLFTSTAASSLDLWALSETDGILGRAFSPPIKLTAGPLSAGAWASSPDGKKSFLLGLETKSETLLYKKGTNHFVPYLPGIPADTSDVSRDGEWIAYSDPTDRLLWKRRSDGSQAVQLMFPPLRIELPRWSPDGKWIAFMGVKQGEETWKVFVVPAEGGESQVVMPSPSPQGAPTWSPDGKRVAFGDLRDASGGFPSSTAIHIVDLTSHKAATLPGSNGLWTARWSPDGLHMAALTTDAKALKVFDFRTNQWQEVASAGSINDLEWSHKGDAVYFLDILPASGPVIYRVRLQDRRVEKVITPMMGSMPIATSWLGLTPDDSILVSNSAGTSEIYALDMDWP